MARCDLDYLLVAELDSALRAPTRDSPHPNLAQNLHSIWRARGIQRSPYKRRSPTRSGLGLAALISL